MLLQFRTKQNANGNVFYLGIDTDKKEFSHICKIWISKDIPELKKTDIIKIKQILIDNNYQYVDCL